MNRVLKTVAAFAFAFSAAACMSVGASAYSGKTVYELHGFDKKQAAFAELIVSSSESFIEEDIDISEFDIDRDEFEVIYAAVILNEPKLHYVDCTQAVLTYDNNQVVAYQPVYHCSYAELEDREKEIERFSDSVMSDIKKNWRDEEIILYVHDRLAGHITYYEGKNTRYGRNIYDAFADGSSVCVGYSLAFQYFMDKLGIPCVNVTSPDHIWNMVKVDGQWYNVDVTWDDSVEITKGTFMHNVLLKSTEDMLSDGEHSKADKAFKAEDSFYCDWFWSESVSNISYLNGYWYYTDPDGLNRYSFDTGESKRVFAMESIWNASEDSEWSVSLSQTAVYGKSVYFNSEDTIYRYDTAKKKVYKVYSPKLSGDEQLYGIKITGNKLIFTVGTWEDTEAVRKSIKLKQN